MSKLIKVMLLGGLFGILLSILADLLCDSAYVYIIYSVIAIVLIFREIIKKNNRKKIISGDKVKINLHRLKTLSVTIIPVAPLFIVNVHLYEL